MPDTLEQLLEKIHTFMHSDVYPLERRFLNEPPRAVLPALDEKRRKVRELGLWAPYLPEAHGGLGLPLRQFARVSEILGTSPIGHYLFHCQAPDVGNLEILIQYGTDAQKAAYLAPLARGAIHSCFAMTEPQYAGSNPVRMGTTAVADGGDYVINGHKWFATAADGAAFAVVMAITDPGAESVHRRASQILVPMDTAGVKLVRNMRVMGEAGSGHFSHGELLFEDCRVPRANLLGPEGEGFRIAQERLGPGRIHHCMRWIGICQRAFELMCRHAATRELAPGRPLGAQQFVQGWIAESRAEIDAARLLVLDAARQIDERGAPAARQAISIIKFHVANVLQNVLDRAVQVHGGLGVIDDTPLAFWARHERAARIYDGADEVHKTVVARRILKQFAADRSDA